MNPIDNNPVPLESLGQGGPMRAVGKSLGQQAFLELMVAQLRNQDPLKPLQNGEFLGQLAQFGTVNGIQELQASFGGLAYALQSNQALMASSLVGRTVTVAGERAALDPASGMKGFVELPQAAAEVTVSIYDSAGTLVRRLTLGPQPAGQVAFTWDGLNAANVAAPAGVYTVKAEATIGGTHYGLTTFTTATVESVSLGGQYGITLNLAGGLGSVPLANVTQIA